MDAFLKQCAAHYSKTGGLENTCFVFPNRRSMVFFRKYLAEALGGKPVLSPLMFTVNDFFYKLHGSRPSDRLSLLVVLYSCYRKLNPEAEPLDDFVFWGDVMLADFDDTDKYLAPAQSLFRNVSDFKDIKDSFSYLTDNQRNAITQFLSHFREGSGGGRVKDGFVKLWNILGPLYEAFRTALREKGMAYEGMVYRDIADKLKEGESVTDVTAAVFGEDTSRFVFIGLNALNECEKLLMKRLRDAGVGEFVWDYVTPEIRNGANKSSFFMSSNIREFPQAFAITAGSMPEVNVISVPSSVGQVKLVPSILTSAGTGVDTAVVLPDEGLLLPLLNSLPPEVEKVNVTMGYPMAGSAVYTLVMALGRMQLKLRRKDGGSVLFYHRPVAEVFSAGLFTSLLSEEEAALVQKVKQDGKYYIPQEDIAHGPVLERVFRDAFSGGTVSLAEYLQELVGIIGRTISGREDLLLEVDFAKRLHTRLTILRDMELDVKPAVWLRLLDNLLKAESVPFKGEPLEGLQIMGPLETRALDFKNIVILSANEGMFPRRSVSSSFIPPELRKGFGLPTYEYQDAVWAYYFYRLLQRSDNIWMLWDNRTEGLHTGEESRYIKQLEYHFGVNVKRFSAAAPVKAVSAGSSIEKTEQMVQTLREERMLSATALQNYLSCPAKFYYRTVEKLLPDNEVAESLDAGMTGNVFHHTMRRLYAPFKTIGVKDLKAMLEDTKTLSRIVREEVLSEMKSTDVEGRNLVIERLILDYVKETLRYDIKLLGTPGSTGEFRIHLLEKDLFMEVCGFRFRGQTDRLDSYREGEIRIVDYKTGKVEKDDVAVTDQTALKVADKLFGPNNAGRPKIALQLYIYDRLVKTNGYHGARVNAIYSTGAFFTDPCPEMPESPEFSRIAGERLEALLQEIADVSVPFNRTEDEATCQYCDFKNICGR